MVKNIVFTIVAIVLCIAFAGCGSNGYLVKDGASEYSIVIAEDASPSTEYGAEELQRFLKEMTNAELPVIRDSAVSSGKEIILGNSNRLEKLSVAVDFDALGDEGYVLKTVGNNLIIAGGELRGNLYGVYGLLEDHFGCRWFTPELSRIPGYDTLRLPRLDETVIPVLEYRDAHIIYKRDGDWSARNRLNSGRLSGLGEKHGGKVDWAPVYFVHTFDRLVPKKEFYDSHPEYFSLVRGERVRERSQLCCTNEDVKRIVTERVKQVLADNPDARLISVSQNDTYNWCECDKCQALATAEGSQTAPVLALVNHVADAIRDEFPDVAVMTLAYQWTRHPCKTLRPRDNVIVRLCSFECCFSHPMDQCDGPANPVFVRDIKDWAKISNRLWVWNYTTNFSHWLQPHPNLLHRRHNIRFFTGNSVTGIFQQDTPNTELGEMTPLGAWLHAKFLWNPDYDQELAITEFLDAYYGPAAPHIREYIDYLHEKTARENIHMGCNESPETALFDGSFFEDVYAMFDKAEKAVKGMPDYERRVAITRLNPDYAWLARDMNTKAFSVDHEALTVELDKEYMDRLTSFAENAIELGIDEMGRVGYNHAMMREWIMDGLPKKELVWTDAVEVNNPQPGITWKYFKEWQDQPEFRNAEIIREGVMDIIELVEHGPTDLFGMVHEGYINIPEDGIYAFYTGSDDGSMIWIDGRIVVDNGGRHWTQERVGFIAFKKGLHRIKTAWFNGGGSLSFDVSWKQPGRPKESVPAEVLYH